MRLKIKHLFAGLLFILTSIMICSCCDNYRERSNELIEQTYEMGGFDRVRLSGSFNIRIEQGEKPSVRVTTTKEQFNSLEINNIDSLLKIENEIDKTPKSIYVLITVVDINRLKISGGVNMETVDTLILENLDIDVEGGANIRMKLQVANVLETSTKGGVNIRFDGKANRFIASSEGACNIYAGSLEAQEVRCKVSGLGNVTVYPRQELDATIEGIGKIAYRGVPQKINKNVNGIGVVFQK